jgi:hypothetical protein
MEQGLCALGFDHVGAYQPERFELLACARNWRSVYLWVQLVDRSLVPRRVGIACGRGGLGARFTLHNRWLAGGFKPNDPREQEVRRLTLLGLGSPAEVWATQVETRDVARALETRLRNQWGDRLALDLKVRASWIALQMSAWRSRRPCQERSSHEPPLLR